MWNPFFSPHLFNLNKFSCPQYLWSKSFCPHYLWINFFCTQNLWTNFLCPHYLWTNISYPQYLVDITCGRIKASTTQCGHNVDELWTFFSLRALSSNAKSCNSVGICFLNRVDVITSGLFKLQATTCSRRASHPLIKFFESLLATANSDAVPSFRRSIASSFTLVIINGTFRPLLPLISTLFSEVQSFFSNSVKKLSISLLT